MILVETRTDKKPTPTSPLPIDCIIYTFSTGHTMTKYMDGTVFYRNKRGKAMNPITGPAVIKDMKKLIMEKE
jgi:hypothetical protein